MYPTKHFYLDGKRHEGFEDVPEILGCLVRVKLEPERWDYHLHHENFGGPLGPEFGDGDAVLSGSHIVAIPSCY